MPETIPEIRGKIMGMQAAVCKPVVSNQHKEQRIEFALQYIAFDNEFWRKVIFSGEKTFSRSDQRRKFVYRLIIQDFQKIILSLNKRSGEIDVGILGMGIW